MFPKIECKDFTSLPLYEIWLTIVKLYLLDLIHLYYLEVKFLSFIKWLYSATSFHCLFIFLYFCTYTFPSPHCIKHKFLISTLMCRSRQHVELVAWYTWPWVTSFHEEMADWITFNCQKQTKKNTSVFFGLERVLYLALYSNIKVEDL